MWNAQDDPDFYRRREAQERAIAERSEGAVRLVHLDMAERYAELLRGLSAAG